MGYDYETSPEAGRDLISLSDMFSVFFEDGTKEEDWGNNLCNNSDDHDDDSEDTVNSDAAGNDAFWEAQHQLLQEALNRGSSIEKRIRADTETALAAPAICRCSVVSPVKGHCRDCAMQEVADGLRRAGYNSALCKSKWRRSPDIPSGEHSYVDVLVEAKKSSTTSSPVRVVIELSFRAEFEMARARPEYNSLVARLPEVFVGKSEKLRNVINIVCTAAKKCTKENKMHLGPWRKHKYMQSKWLGPCQRTLVVAPPLPVAPTVSDRQRKTRMSMLTFDLHCTAVEVLSLAPMVHHVPHLLAQF